MSKLPTSKATVYFIAGGLVMHFLLSFLATDTSLGQILITDKSAHHTIATRRSEQRIVGDTSAVPPPPDISERFPRWDIKCQTLLADGKWKEALQLAIDAPLFHPDSTYKYPLDLVVKEIHRLGKTVEAIEEVKRSSLNTKHAAQQALFDLAYPMVFDNPFVYKQALNGLDLDQLGLSQLKEEMILACLQKDPTRISNTDLEGIFSESRSPLQVIPALARALAPATDRALEWAASLPTAAQRTEATTTILYSLADNRDPSTWELIKILPDKADRTYLVERWVSSMRRNNNIDLTSIPDEYKRLATDEIQKQKR